MKLKYPFKDKVRNLYLDNHCCFDCDSNQMVELHHIKGRVSDSMYNSIPLCNDCHSHCGHSKEEEERYLLMSFFFHKLKGHEETEEDREFIYTHCPDWQTMYNVFNERN